MDLNLNDFSGIGLEESQFMDQSNAGINNVFGNNSLIIADPQLAQQTTNNAAAEQQHQNPTIIHEEFAYQPKGPQAMIQIEDIGALEMSRISIGLGGNQMGQGMEHQMVAAAEEQKAADKLVEQNKPPVLEPAVPQQPAAKADQWKKPKFQKKKRFGNANKKAAPETSSNDLQIQIPAADEKEKVEAAPKNVRTNKEMYLAAQQKRKVGVFQEGASPRSPGSPGVPLPLFDCMFCVGFHEHLVLQTIKERQISTKYGYLLPGQKKLAEDEEEDLARLDYCFMIGIMKAQRHATLLLVQPEELPEEEEVPMTTQDKLRQAIGAHRQTWRPLQTQVDKIREKVAAQKVKEKKTLAPPVSSSLARKQATQSPRNEQLMISNILENFEEIDDADQSMFMNCRIKTRRQKILLQMSFETEVFDIYDPVFSSQESQSETSSSQTSMSTNSRNSAAVEQDQDLLDMDYYDSDNKSALSSIHKEIAPVLDVEEGNMPPDFSQKPTEREAAQFGGLGGCQMEEMQDDTVVNRCNNMLQRRQRAKVAQEHQRDWRQQQIDDAQPLSIINDESVIQLPMPFDHGQESPSHQPDEVAHVVVGRGFQLERPKPGHGPKSKSEFEDGRDGVLFWKRESLADDPISDERYQRRTKSNMGQVTVASGSKDRNRATKPGSSIFSPPNVDRLPKPLVVPRGAQIDKIDEEQFIGAQTERLAYGDHETITAAQNPRKVDELSAYQLKGARMSTKISGKRTLHVHHQISSGGTLNQRKQRSRATSQSNSEALTNGLIAQTAQFGKRAQNGGAASKQKFLSSMSGQSSPGGNDEPPDVVHPMVPSERVTVTRAAMRGLTGSQSIPNGLTAVGSSGSLATAGLQAQTRNKLQYPEKTYQVRSLNKHHPMQKSESHLTPGLSRASQVTGSGDRIDSNYGQPQLSHREVFETKTLSVEERARQLGVKNNANVLTATKSKQNFKISRQQLNQMVAPPADEAADKRYPFQKNAAAGAMKTDAAKVATQQQARLAVARQFKKTPSSAVLGGIESNAQPAAAAQVYGSVTNKPTMQHQKSAEPDDTALSKKQIKFMKQLQQMQKLQKAKSDGPPATQASGLGATSSSGFNSTQPQQAAQVPRQTRAIATNAHQSSKQLTTALIKKKNQFQQMTQESNLNRKNVIENYFQIGSAAQTQIKPLQGLTGVKSQPLSQQNSNAKKPNPGVMGAQQAAGNTAGTKRGPSKSKSRQRSRDRSQTHQATESIQKLNQQKSREALVQHVLETEQSAGQKRQIIQTDAINKRMGRDSVKPASSALMHEGSRDLPQTEPQRKWITPAAAQGTGANNRAARAGVRNVGKFEGTQISSPIVSPSQQAAVSGRTFKKSVMAVGAGKTAQKQLQLLEPSNSSSVKKKPTSEMRAMGKFSSLPDSSTVLTFKDADDDGMTHVRTSQPEMHLHQNWMVEGSDLFADAHMRQRSDSGEAGAHLQSQHSRGGNQRSVLHSSNSQLEPLSLSGNEVSAVLHVGVGVAQAAQQQPKFQRIDAAQLAGLADKMPITKQPNKSSKVFQSKYDTTKNSAPDHQSSTQSRPDVATAMHKGKVRLTRSRSKEKEDQPGRFKAPAAIDLKRRTNLPTSMASVNTPKQAAALLNNLKATSAAASGLSAEKAAVSIKLMKHKRKMPQATMINMATGGPASNFASLPQQQRQRILSKKDEEQYFMTQNNNAGVDEEKSHSKQHMSLMQRQQHVAAQKKVQQTSQQQTTQMGLTTFLGGGNNAANTTASSGSAAQTTLFLFNKSQNNLSKQQKSFGN